MHGSSSLAFPDPFFFYIKAVWQRETTVIGLSGLAKLRLSFIKLQPLLPAVYMQHIATVQPKSKNFVDF